MDASTQLMRLLLVVTALLVCGGCQSPTSSEGNPAADLNVREVAEQWLDIYSQRDNWEAFLDCYAENMKFEDQRVRQNLDGRKAFAKFYNWPDERFRLVDPEKPVLEVYQLVVEGRTVVVRGRFLPFYWGEEVFDFQDDFVFWLEFNDRGKIIYQRDYIPYPKSLLPD